MNTAIDISHEQQAVAEDIHILVLIAYLIINNSNINFLNPLKEKLVRSCIPLKVFLSILPCKNICDNTSVFFRQGNLKFVRTLENYFKNFSIVLTPFLQKGARPGDYIDLAE